MTTPSELTGSKLTRKAIRKCLKKASYECQRKARYAAKNASLEAGYPIRVYYCDICGGYHLTKQKKGAFT